MNFSIVHQVIFKGNHKLAYSNFLRGKISMNRQKYLVINVLVNILRVKFSQMAIDS